MKPLHSETFPLSGSRLIEASAGTGKTYTITNLYLRLLLGQGETGSPLGISEILVLTFTIAATEELRSRIRKRIADARLAFEGYGTLDPFLQHLIDSSKDVARDRKLLVAALQLLDEASIFTIHGFCARVLADNAFETQTLFDQSLDADRDSLLEVAVEDCFRSEILTLPVIARTRALALWSSPDQLLMKLKSFLFRDALTMLPPLRPMDAADLERRVSRLKALWIDDDLEARVRGAGLGARSRSISQLGAMRAWCTSDDMQTDLLEYWTSEFMASKLNKNGAVPEHEAIALIDAIWNDIIQLDFNLWHQVATRVRDNLERAKQELSQLTLDDLLIKVRDALVNPGSGEWLATTLAARWPVAMIDEFQDTDDVQYEIFSNIYPNDGDHNLFFIGDPKQAIYQFRGADVFTYINAKRSINQDEDLFSLSTNWRSTGPLVEAVNRLFDQPGIFDNDADIPFERVAPSPHAADHRFTQRGYDVAPVTLFQVTSDTNRNKDQIRRLAMSFAAEETARILNGGAEDDIHIDDSPVHAGQIAILVRDKNDARAARDALAARGIRSVYVTLESVFLSETAEDLRVILQAVLEPTNERALRAALAVPLMQSSASEIAALSTDIRSQQAVLQEFLQYHELWARLDVASMLERLTINRHIAQKWFGKQDGERQITNLRHLTELLQKRAAIAPGMHRLLKWFTREKQAADTVAAEERQLRLESDSDLVQIVTMHASKGLEYDIVMIPMAAFVAQSRSGEPCLLHETVQGKFQTVLDFSDDPAHRELSAREKLAEDMRLLYVGITRAKYKCYIGVPDTQDLKKSALARLLQLDTFDAPDVSAQLNATFAAPLFDVTRVEHTETTRFQARDTTSHLAPPARVPGIIDNWRLHSYTGVSRLIHATAQGVSSAEVTPGYADDEATPTDGREPRERPAENQFSAFDFPRGPQAGVALHTLLEDLDFTQPIDAQMSLVGHCLDRLSLTSHRTEWTRGLIAWLNDILACPLPGGASLKQIDRKHRLDEMEFHFPLATDERLVTLLREHNYLTQGASLNVAQLSGMMTGLIDLVYEHDGKFWLVDYKSNHLGFKPEDYNNLALAEAITHHQYDLQYLIYCVALNRFLASRIEDYDYDSHFGGAAYLFLRGMTSGKGGVFFDRPEKALILQLDAVMGAAP